jgi:hypothetical protein
MKYIIPILILLSLTACRTIKPERPGEYYPDAEHTAPVSTINVPVEFDVAKLEKLFNKEFSGVIYSDTSFSDNNNDNLKLKAYKRENITFKIENGLLSYRVPLLVEITKRFSLSAFGMSVNDTKDATASIALKFNTKLSVNPNWSISSYTTSAGYEWITTPALRLGPVSLPLPLISDLLLEANLETISKEIDAAIRESLNLRTMATESWTALQQPIQISPDPPLWLSIRPIEASAVPLQVTEDGFKEIVGVSVVAELFFGTPHVRPVVTEIPPLKITSRLDEGFTVSMTGEIPFTEMNAIAKKQLAGYTFRQGKYVLKVEDAELYGKGDKLVVAANVSGSVKGTIYLTGTPWFDKTTNTLRIRELDFDVRTKNTLVKSASWLLKGGITGKLTESLSFPASEYLSEARKQIGGFLSQKHSYGYFTFTGRLDQIDIGRILITRSSVKALFTFSGNLTVGLKED